MKKRYLVFLIMLIVVLNVGCSSENKVADSDISMKATEKDIAEIESPNEEETLLFVAGEYPPFAYENGEDDGFYIELVREAYNRKGIKTEFEFYPWSRCVEMLKSHDAFGSAGWIQNVDRYENSVFSNNIYATDTKIYYMDGNKKVPKEYTNIKDFLDLKVGGIDAYYYIETLKSIGLDLDIAQTERDGLHKLYNGRTDVVIMDESTGEAIINKDFPNEVSKFKIYDVPYRRSYQGIRVWKDYPNKEKYLNQFNESLKEMIEDGTYGELIKKYDLAQQPKEIYDIQYVDEPLKIGYTNFPPYEYKSDTGEAIGVGVDTLREALALLGYGQDDYVFEEYPWARLMEKGRKGQLDMVIDAFYTENREEFFYYSKGKYAIYDYHFIVNEDSLVEYNGEKLSENIKKIGVVRGYKYGDEIEAKIDSLMLERNETASSVDLLEGLLNNRYDMVIEASLFSEYYLKTKSKKEQVRYLEPSIGKKDAYILYPKVNTKNDDLIKNLDRILEELRNDGIYQKIYRKYIENI